MIRLDRMTVPDLPRPAYEVLAQWQQGDVVGSVMTSGEDAIHVEIIASSSPEELRNDFLKWLLSLPYFVDYLGRQVAQDCAARVAAHMFSETEERSRYCSLSTAGRSRFLQDYIDAIDAMLEGDRLELSKTQLLLGFNKRVFDRQDLIHLRKAAQVDLMELPKSPAASSAHFLNVWEMLTAKLEPQEIRARLAEVWAGGRLAKGMGAGRSTNPYMGVDPIFAKEWDRGWQED